MYIVETGNGFWWQVAFGGRVIHCLGISVGRNLGVTFWDRGGIWASHFGTGFPWWPCIPSFGNWQDRVLVPGTFWDWVLLWVALG